MKFFWKFSSPFKKLWFPQIFLKKNLFLASSPLLIHWPDTGWGCCAGAGAPNISANGFPNCNKSSKAFDGCAGCADAPSAAPNKSTMLPDEAGGDDKNGFVAVGEPIFDCF